MSAPDRSTNKCRESRNVYEFNNELGLYFKTLTKLTYLCARARFSLPPHRNERKSSRLGNKT